MVGQILDRPIYGLSFRRREMFFLRWASFPLFGQLFSLLFGGDHWYGSTVKMGCGDYIGEVGLLRDCTVPFT